MRGWAVGRGVWFAQETFLMKEKQSRSPSQFRLTAVLEVQADRFRDREAAKGVNLAQQV